ncbi:MAG: hypothetical protein WDO13_06635 [Verrucomicrobiota bacterium]
MIALGIPLLLVLAVAFFYAEENWRGALAWQQAQTDIEAGGVSLDRRALIPAPIPDEQNLAAIPLLTSIQETDYPYSWQAPALKKALQPLFSHLPSNPGDDATPDHFPYLSFTQEVTPRLPGHGANPGNRLWAGPRSAVPISASATATEALERLCPALAELRAENAHRPDCVFPRKFDHQPPHMPSFAPAISLLSLARVLVLEESTAIAEGQTALALDDILIQHGVDVKARDKDGDTALHQICMFGKSPA